MLSYSCPVQDVGFSVGTFQIFYITMKEGILPWPEVPKEKRKFWSDLGFSIGTLNIHCESSTCIFALATSINETRKY